MRRTVFFISDSTGITAETIGNSMLAQFEGVQFDTHRLPFIDNPAKAEAACLRIKTKYAQDGQRPIVVNTMTSRTLCDIVAGSGALMLDVFAPFIDPLEAELGAKQSGAVNRSHGLVDFERYEARIEATNYALAHDDGLDVDYNQADVVLVGSPARARRPLASTWPCITASAPPIIRSRTTTSTSWSCRRVYALIAAGCSVSPSTRSAWRRFASSAVPAAATPR